MSDSVKGTGAPPASTADIRDVVGRVSDDVVLAILGTGATVAEMEEAAAWAAGESDVMAKRQKPLTGAAAAVCDILTQAGDWPEEGRSPPAA